MRSGRSRNAARAKRDRGSDSKWERKMMRHRFTSVRNLGFRSAERLRGNQFRFVVERNGAVQELQAADRLDGRDSPIALNRDLMVGDTSFDFCERASLHLALDADHPWTASRQ